MAKSTKKKIEVEGIKLTIDMSRLDDFEVVEAIADMSNESADDNSKMCAVVQLFRLVFGGEYARVKAELRAAHDGVLSSQTMTDFFMGVLGALGAKN